MKNRTKQKAKVIAGIELDVQSANHKNRSMANIIDAATFIKNFNPKSYNRSLILLGLVVLLLTSCSFLKSKCSVCSGTGKTDCTNCYHTGEANCSQCNGTGKENCSWCNGQGKKNCPDCNGQGTRNLYVGGSYKDGYQYVYYMGYSGYTNVIGGSINPQCDKCSGTGKIKCSNYDCDYGKVKCSRLSCKNGKVECSYCNGSGRETCLTCGGTGQSN